MWCPCAGKGGMLCVVAHVFHRWNAAMYFFAEESALLWINVEGSLPNNLTSSGSLSPLYSGQTPASSISIYNGMHHNMR